MLPKSKRLTKKDFIGVRPQTFFRGTYFDCAVIPNELGKFGVVISKKRIKRAVDRNTAKRRVYTRIKDLGITLKRSIVIYPKQTILNSKKDLVLVELRKAFDTL